MSRLRLSLKKLLAWKAIPWAFLGLTAMALLFQFHPDWRRVLIYDRALIQSGEVWRLWTGHFIHFGWPHFIADAGLFLILGRLLERNHPVAMRVTLVLMPLTISAALYGFDPELNRYAGLSAINLGLLLFYAACGWQKNRIDWFWSGVLAIYVGEVILEIFQGHGHGGGMIRFDDPTIHVATSAHIAGGLYGLALWLLVRRRQAGPEQR